jgi:hypothetical protein
MSLGIAAPCAITPPKFAIPYAATVFANTTVQQFDISYPIDPVNNPYVLDANSEQPFFNLLQAVYAAIRVDLGNPSLNNFILNPLALNDTIFQTFPVTPYNQDQSSTTSTLYSQWHNPSPALQKYLPINVSGPAQIQVAYPCRFQQRKPLGSLVVSVLVATLSMFSSAWAVFIHLATTYAKGTDPAGIPLSLRIPFLLAYLELLANRCDGHCSRHRMTVEPSWFDSYDAYGLQHTGGSGYPPSPPPKNYVYAPLNT